MENGFELKENIIELSNSFQNKSLIKSSNNNNDKKELLINKTSTNIDKNIDISNNNLSNKLNKDIISTNSKILSNSKNKTLTKYYFYKKLGNCFSFFGNKNGDPLFIIGPNWAFYVCFSFFISAFILYLYIFGILLILGLKC